MAEHKPNEKDFPTRKGDTDKLLWDEAANTRSVCFLFREQIIEDRFIESCLKHTTGKTLLIGEQVCDDDLPDIGSLDKLVKKALEDVSKFNPKVKFDLFISESDSDGVRIDHLDSSTFNLKKNLNKVWGLRKRSVPACKTPARKEKQDETDDVKSKKARTSYAETAPIIKSIGVLFQNRSSQNIFWKNVTKRDGAHFSLAACDPDEPTSFFVRINKPELGMTYLEQLFKSAMAEFTLAIMESGDQSSKFDIMLEYTNGKESLRINDQDHEDFDLKKLLHSV